MRLLAVLALLGGFSHACAAAPCGDGTVEKDGECVAADGLTEGDADTDTDTDADADADADPVIVDVSYEEGARVVVWNIEVDGVATDAEIWMLQTGDPAYEGGCGVDDIGDGGIVCGVWSERHDAFVATDAGGGTTLSLALDITSDFTEQATNSSTLFRSPYIETTSWLVEIDGGADCLSGGDAPTTFRGDCPD